VEAFPDTIIQSFSHEIKQGRVENVNTDLEIIGVRAGVVLPVEGNFFVEDRRGVCSVWLPSLYKYTHPLGCRPQSTPGGL